jgi:hypothetical protein
LRSLDPVKRTDIIKGSRHLLQSTPRAVNGERQRTTATISQARNVMPRLQ